MRKFTLIIFIMFYAASCGPVSCWKADNKTPDLGGLYDRAAKRAHEYGNPVIVIPGILGSKLRDSESGQLVWGAFEKNTSNPETPEGARLIALPMQPGVPLSELGDTVYADGTLDKVKVRVFGLPIELNAYINILHTLGVGGYLDQVIAPNALNNIDYGDDHFTCFQFAYDWRLDNVENAKRLKEFIEEKKAYVLDVYKKRGIDKDDVQFNIVAHSMGGLVTRYFLRYGGSDLPKDGSEPEVTWEGAAYVDKVVLIGTPNAGSLGAAENLLQGKDFGPLLPKYDVAVLGTMPSMYQLLPRSRHRTIVNDNGEIVDILDPEYWIENELGLANPDQDSVLEWLLPDVTDDGERREIAIDHLRKSLARAKQFQQAMDVPATPPDDMQLHLIAGDAIPTAARITIDSSAGGFTVTDYQPGDGTVTRSSALLDERQLTKNWTSSLVSPIEWDNVLFLFSDHLGLTEDPVFSDNILFLLLEKP